MNHRGETFTLEQSRPSERLDVFLRSRFPAVSRGAIQRLIEQGHIRVNDQVVKPTHVPRAGEKVSIFWPEAQPAEAKPQAMSLDILFEDADLLVLNKPPGIVVHPAAGHDEGTLVNALLHHCGAELSGIGGVARPGIVHRLDKDTSGCLVAAKNDFTHQKLAEQFAGRTVEKIYGAILCGELAREHGNIRAPIARHPTHRKRMAVVEGGREAWTGYEVRERLHGATWVATQLHTGRTHQIRVHFQYLGFPLAGDATYGRKQNARLEEQLGARVPRQMLHAHKLGFTHPRTGRPMKLESPLPADFEQMLQTLRAPA